MPDSPSVADLSRTTLYSFTLPQISNAGRPAIEFCHPAHSSPYNRRVAGLNILFVCVGNSCRSPMAEAIARKLGGGFIEARSAGLAPAGWIAERTLTTLEFLGYSTDGLSSKGLDAVSSVEIDVVISLLGEETLDLMTVAAGARHDAWPILDPFGEDEEVYIDVARRLEARIRRLLEEELDRELPGLS